MCALFSNNKFQKYDALWFKVIQGFQTSVSKKTANLPVHVYTTDVSDQNGNLERRYAF